jgi:hypothetical protein
MEKVYACIICAKIQGLDLFYPWCSEACELKWNDEGVYNA